jgi:hypothetical protein
MYDQKGTPIPNSPFAGYTVTINQYSNLREAERYVKGYIEACSSAKALEMDPEICKKIGGHIHIAEITPDGFRWRVPPLS